MKVSEFCKFPRKPNEVGGFVHPLKLTGHELQIGDIILVRSFAHLQQNIWLRHREDLIYPWPMDTMSTCGFKVVKLKK